jgi:hypothetical protein
LSACTPGCSGPDQTHAPSAWDLADPGRRRDLYEIVLVEATLDDIQRLVNGDALVELWDQMYSHRGYALPGDH